MPFCLPGAHNCYLKKVSYSFVKYKHTILYNCNYGIPFHTIQNIFKYVQSMNPTVSIDFYKIYNL